MTAASSPEKSTLPQVTPRQFKEILDPLDQALHDPSNPLGRTVEYDDGDAGWQAPTGGLPPYDELRGQDAEHVPVHILVRIRRTVETLLARTEGASEETQAQRVAETCKTTIAKLEAAGINETLLQRSPFTIDQTELDARNAAGDFSDSDEFVMLALMRNGEAGLPLEASELEERAEGRKTEVIALDAPSLLRAVSNCQEDIPYFLYVSAEGKVVRIEVYSNDDDEEIIVINAFDHETNRRLHPPVTMTMDDRLIIFPEQLGNLKKEAKQPALPES